MKLLLVVLAVMCAQSTVAGEFTSSSSYRSLNSSSYSSYSEAVSGYGYFGCSSGCCPNYEMPAVLQPILTTDYHATGTSSGAECLDRYRVDVIFEARSARIEGVGAQSLFEFMSKLNEAAASGCEVPSTISVVGYACIGCDKSKGQSDKVVQDLASLRAANLVKAAQFIRRNRNFGSLANVQFVPTTQVVDEPTLGVIPKSAIMEGVVEH